MQLHRKLRPADYFPNKFIPCIIFMVENITIGTGYVKPPVLLIPIQDEILCVFAIFDLA